MRVTICTGSVPSGTLQESTVRSGGAKTRHAVTVLPAAEGRVHLGAEGVIELIDDPEPMTVDVQRLGLR